MGGKRESERERVRECKSRWKEQQQHQHHQIPRTRKVRATSIYMPWNGFIPFKLNVRWILFTCREREKKKLRRRTKDFVTQVFVQFAVDATMISILYYFCRCCVCVCMFLLYFNGITVIIIANEDAHPPNIQFVYMCTHIKLTMTIWIPRRDKK